MNQEEAGLYQAMSEGTDKGAEVVEEVLGLQRLDQQTHPFLVIHILPYRNIIHQEMLEGTVVWLPTFRAQLYTT